MEALREDTARHQDETKCELEGKTRSRKWKGKRILLRNTGYFKDRMKKHLEKHRKWY